MASGSSCIANIHSRSQLDGEAGKKARADTLGQSCRSGHLWKRPLKSTYAGNPAWSCTRPIKHLETRSGVTGLKIP